MRKLHVVLAMAIFMAGLNSIAISEESTSPQDDRYAPSRLGIPDAIGGYRVLAVLTEGNFVCMRPREKRLVLQSAQSTIEDGPRDFPKELIEHKLQALSLAETAQWESTVVGPGVNREQLIHQFEQTYRFFQTHECPTLKLPIATSSVLAAPEEKSCPLIAGNELIGGEARCEKPQPGFTIIQNHGPDIYSTNNG